MLFHVDGERAGRRLRLDPVTDREPVMEVARYESGLGARLSRTGPDPLDCETVPVGPGSVRQRVRSHDSTLDTWNRQPNGQVLAWLIRRQRSSVLRYQVERGNIFALAHFLSQAEWAKA